MNDGAKANIISESAAPVTPRQLAQHLQVSLIDVAKALVLQGKYLLFDEQMDVGTAQRVAAQLRSGREDSPSCVSLPSEIERKPRRTALQISVERRGLRELYHFTPLDNLHGIIVAGALLSRRQVSERGMQSIHNSWGNSEKERTIGADYICLSITNQWAMLTKVMMRSPCPPAVLVVEPHVIWREGTCFSPKNSASRDIAARKLRKWTHVSHFDALFASPDDRRPKDSQAEVLVRDRIPLDDVSEIAFYDQDAFEQTWQLCGLDRADPLIGKVCISRKYYPPLEYLYEAYNP